MAIPKSKRAPASRVLLAMLICVLIFPILLTSATTQVFSGGWTNITFETFTNNSVNISNNFYFNSSNGQALYYNIHNVVNNGSPASTLSSGVYTPGLTNIQNVAASSASPAQWMRVGNVVTVSGRINIDTTLASTTSITGIGIPVASNFATDSDAAGVAVSVEGTTYNGAIYSNSTEDSVRFEYISALDVTPKNWSYIYTYEVLP